MITVSTKKEFLAQFDEHGKPKAPFALAEGCALFGLYSVTSLGGVKLSEGCRLYGLNHVNSLDSVTFAKKCLLHGLTSVRSLDGVMLPEGCTLSSLRSVTSLGGVKLSEGCRLNELYSVTSLGGVKLSEGCTLRGLPNNLDIASNVTPSDEEIVLMRQIPLDGLEMSDWHTKYECGTSHCLYGWAQSLAGNMHAKPFSEGQRLLPSMQPFVFMGNEPMKRYLEGLHKAA